MMHSLIIHILNLFKILPLFHLQLLLLSKLLNVNINEINYFSSLLEK